MGILSGILLALQYLPTVIQAVVSIEKTIKDAPGAAKKSVIINAVKTSAPEATEHIQVISNLVDNVVSTLNATGVFKE